MSHGDPADPPHEPGPNTLRDHLANERTFLAWMRTAITIVALGFVVAKFGILLREEGFAKIHQTSVRLGAVVGVVLVFGGGITAYLALRKFLRTRQEIDHEIVNFQPDLDIALAAIVGLTSLLLAVYIVITS